MDPVQDHGVDTRSVAIINETTGEAFTSIACYMCRKRKIKCNRLYPTCHNCTQNQQTCTYPRRVTKPGPKIGSIQSNRKRNEELPPPAQAKKPRVTAPTVTSSTSLQQSLLLPPPAQAYAPSLPMQQAHSPSASTPSTTASHLSRDITSLSFILHPSLEPRDIEPYDELNQSPDIVTDDNSTIASACSALGVGSTEMNQLVDEFFDTFTSFQLFRRANFFPKLHHIGNLSQVKALMASIFMFSVRSRDSSPNFARTTAENENQDSNTSEHFCDLAIQYADDAIAECDENEEQLPLNLLQALVLISHWLLSKSAHGRAWRYLGLAVRSAYDLNLHMVDFGKGPSSHLLESPERWAADEEKRRAWWALWEMDVFASVIRRRPMAISWSQNQTRLPAEDEKWERSEPQESCLLSPSYVDRWKLLEKTGNQSPKAWYIIINSLMKDAQLLSSPMAHDTTPTGEEDRETFNQLMAMHNVLHCTTEMLPYNLRYENQFLNFSPKDVDSAEAPSRRARDAAIYSIHLMIQLARMMTYKFYVFRMRLRWPQLQRELATMKEHTKRGTVPERQLGSIVPTNATRQALTLYIAASDSVVEIIQRTSGSHYKFVNPFIANTIWLAAAVQLLHRELIPAQSVDKVLICSNFELLCMTYRQFVKYWDISATLQKNLDTLEEELKNLQTLGKEVALERRLSFDSQSVSLQAGKRAVSSASGLSTRGFNYTVGGLDQSQRTASPVPHNNSNSKALADQHRDLTAEPAIGRSINKLQPQAVSHQDHDTQSLEQEPPQHHDRSQQLDVQARVQSSALNGQQPSQGGVESIIIENHSRLQTPSQQRQDLPFAFNHSPLPSLSGDIFSDTLRFDDGLRDMNNRNDFYDNLNYVLSGSYE